MYQVKSLLCNSAWWYRSLALYFDYCCVFFKFWISLSCWRDESLGKHLLLISSQFPLSERTCVRLRLIYHSLSLLFFFSPKVLSFTIPAHNQLLHILLCMLNCATEIYLGDNICSFCTSKFLLIYACFQLSSYKKVWSDNCRVWKSRIWQILCWRDY